MTTIIRNTNIISSDADRHLQRNVSIGLDEGKIVWVSLNDENLQPAEARIIDGSGTLAIPGLIDAHTHSQHALQKGQVSPSPIEAWMPIAAAAAGDMGEREGYVCAMVACIDHLKSGTTAILDHFVGSDAALEGALAAYDEAGLRAYIAPMISNKRFHDSLGQQLQLTSDVRAELDHGDVPGVGALVDRYERRLKVIEKKRELITPLVGTSNPFRCTDELLIACHELAVNHKTKIHSHLLESRWSALAAYEEHGESLVEHLASLGVLSERNSFAHGVWLSEREMDILAEANVTIVHLPWSNLWLGSGIADVHQLTNRGVQLALGTDGMSGGTNSNVFDAIRLTADLHNVRQQDPDQWIGAEKVWEFATSGSATAIGAKDTLGQLEAGYAGDLSLLDLNTTTFAPLHDAQSQLVHFESGSSVRTVIVDCEVVVEDREILSFNEADILEEAQSIVDRWLTDNRHNLEFAAQVSDQYKARHKMLTDRPVVDSRPLSFNVGSPSRQKSKEAGKRRG
jgi:5-methylthioadenosine/S-adenosylhomocysteine deaminase